MEVRQETILPLFQSWDRYEIPEGPKHLALSPDVGGKTEPFQQSLMVVHEAVTWWVTDISCHQKYPLLSHADQVVSPLIAESSMEKEDRAVWKQFH